MRKDSGADSSRAVRTALAALFFATLVASVGCAQNMNAIKVPDSTAATPQEQCGIAPAAMLTSAQALCIAKVSGLKRGIARWTVSEYADYVDVSNTTSKYPVEKGLGVRIARLGGRVLSIEPWEAVVVR